MAIEAASAKHKVASYGFERFPLPVDVFSDEDEPAWGRPPRSSRASSDKIVEHELVYPPKAFPGEELNHDWLAMMLNEQHEVHMRASTALQKARMGVDSAAAELMKLKYELNEERNAFRKMLEKLETTIGADEMASLVGLMEKGMEHGSFGSSDGGSDTSVGDDAADAEQAAGEDGDAQPSDHEHADGETSNAATDAARYHAEDEDESDDEPRVHTRDSIEGLWRMDELNRRAENENDRLRERFTTEEVSHQHNKERDANDDDNKSNESRAESRSGDKVERVAEPRSVNIPSILFVLSSDKSESDNNSQVHKSTSTVTSRSLFVPDPSSVLHQEHSHLYTAHLASSPKIGSNDVQQDALSSKRAPSSSNLIDEVPQDTQPSPKATLPAEEREVSPDALSYTSRSDYGEKREEQRKTVAPLLSPIHLSDPESDDTPQVAVGAISPQRSSTKRLPSLCGDEPAPAELGSSPSPPAPLAPSPTVQHVEEVVLTVDAAATTTRIETTAAPTSSGSPITSPAAEQPAAANRPQPAESIEFISANFDTSQYRGPITRKRGRAAAGFEPEAVPAKRVRNDSALSASPDMTKPSVSASVAAPPPLPMPTTAPATTSALQTVTQESPATASASIFAPILSAFEISKRVLSFSSRSNSKK